MAAAVCPTAYSWADDTQGLDPCAVASQLLAVCSPGAVLSSIGFFETYPSPIPQTDCSCSSPVYALVSACADCQGGIVDSWKDWSHGCVKTFNSNFPKTPPVNIPQWATFDVTLQHSYNREFAEAIAEAQAPPTSPNSTPDSAPSFPASTAAATVSDTIDPASASATSDVASGTGLDGASNTASNTAPSTTTPVQTTPTTAIDASPSSLNAAYSADIANGSTAPGASQPTSLGGQANSLESTNKKSSNTGAIAGGTIGGLILLVILGGILFWWIARRRRSRTAPSAAFIAALRPPTSLSARPLGERSNSALESGDLNPAYHDEEKYETTYPVDRKGSRYTHLPRDSSPGVYGPS